MKVTKEWIKENYDICNEKYFDGKLPEIGLHEIEITMDKNVWGRGGCRRFVKVNGEYQAQGVVLKMSNYYDSPEKDKLEVLVHEMCHIYEYFCEPEYYIQAAYVYRKWTTSHPKHGHGIVFNEQANRLKQYGFNVQRFVTSAEIENAEVSDEIQQKRRKSISKGFTAFKFELKTPTRGRNGNIYTCGYIFPAQSKVEEFTNYVYKNLKNYKRAEEMFTHDPNMLKFKKLNSVGVYYLTNDYDGIFKGVEFESKKDLCGNVEEKPQEKPVVNKIPIFNFKYLKNGEQRLFKMVGATLKEIEAKLRSEFPNFSDAAINNILNNKKNYSLMESMTLTEEDIRKMVREALEEVLDKGNGLLTGNDEYINLPDVLPGHVDIN